MIDVADRGEKARVLSEETIAPDLHDIMTWQIPELPHVKMLCRCVLWACVCEGGGRGSVKTAHVVQGVQTHQGECAGCIPLPVSKLAVLLWWCVSGMC